LLKKAPKFGNDDDYVDSIVNAVLTHASDTAAQYTSVIGARSNLGAGTVTASLPLGYVVGALPDGRKAGEPLAEGGISGSLPSVRSNSLPQPAMPAGSANPFARLTLFVSIQAPRTPGLRYTGNSAWIVAIVSAFVPPMRCLTLAHIIPSMSCST
jgi:hypothetical protein